MAPVLAYEQVIPSHDNETVPDVVDAAIVDHLPGEAQLKPVKPTSCEGVTHAPAHNPVNTIPPSRLLREVALRYESVGGAKLGVVAMCCDNVLIVKPGVSQSGIARVSGAIPYTTATGICDAHLEVPG
ncbi:hypothetical protein FGG08_004424 [Glutinoglossum americanum]|uniref:Uncharacterized protein n=1 Tax=Glutinoglossum americanum TaxID=1670608 RepID=A0A9P8I5T0_9PEZI|nr:hypothetical protein FGG08_004424 [Glutinoglossum americanum]